MLTAITMVTAMAALFAALLLVYASFDQPASTAAPHFGSDGQPLRSIRQLGLRSAIIALIGSYLVVFLT
jgi:hypothetical protein